MERAASWRSRHARRHKALIEKIEALPAERIAEIEDFVDFIRSREQERTLTARCRCRERSGFCRHLEQSRRRRLRCPLTSATSSWCHFRSPAKRASKRGLRSLPATAPTAPPGLICIVMAVTSQIRPNLGLGEASISALASCRAAQALRGQTGVRDPRTAACPAPARHP